ncbi:MAG TPA: GNAT family N-acetyltransferase [Spirochaetota bacterium]|nr:MAG: ribosomal-protein-alanine N-acetyltransferase [Spirochaetes bacterium ADurb.Bin133]HNZ27334.1 GNAT family N-acetyltransferase [Spirochaetota bacterium]HPY86475.1 GNAT family N-acetyltransferase [Spirochaetota bacterium]HQB60074.1 GNAT family N-acetyltransferase [Spirochaetota bacterium]
MNIKYVLKKDALIIAGLNKYFHDNLLKNNSDLFVDFDYDKTLEGFVNFLKNDRFYSYIVFDDLYPIGYAIFGFHNFPEPIFKNDKKKLFIGELLILPDYQNKNIGTILLNLIKDFAKENNVNRVETDFWVPNNQSISFFSKNLFKTEVTEMHLNVLNNHSEIKIKSFKENSNLQNNNSVYKFEYKKDIDVITNLSKIAHLDLENNYPDIIDKYDYKKFYKMFENQLKNDNYYSIIVYDDKTPIGLAVFQEFSYPSPPFKNNIKCFHIDHFDVIYEYQNKGIGSKLIDEIKNKAIDNGISRIALHVWETNYQAKNFYIKKGFKDVKICMINNLKNLL